MDGKKFVHEKNQDKPVIQKFTDDEKPSLILNDWGRFLCSPTFFRSFEKLRYRKRLNSVAGEDNKIQNNSDVFIRGSSNVV